VSVFAALIVPAAGLLIGLGVLIGGRVGQVLLIVGTAAFGAACVLALAQS
jgi:hypothetical protein